MWGVCGALREGVDSNSVWGGGREGPWEGVNSNKVVMWRGGGCGGLPQQEVG